jgi:hypothetical protein
MHNHRPHPHVAIPYDARGPPPNTEVYSSYAVELGSASSGVLNTWDTATPTARQPTSRPGIAPHTRSRTRSALEPVPPNLGLQVPEIYRSSSQRQTAYEYYHRSSKSDSEHPFGEEYGSTSDRTSPYSPSVNLPADEVGFPLQGLQRAR